jgi:hypothetical protein
MNARTVLGMVAFAAATVCACSAQSRKVVMCQRLDFGGHLTFGEEYKQALGSDLTFVLMPSATGWEMEIEGPNPKYPSTPGNYLGIASPPYHFNRTVSIDDSYATRLEEAVKNSPREFHFALDTAQYEEISNAVDIALYSGESNAAEQEKADDFVLNRMEEVTGSGEFSIMSSEIGKVKGEKKDVILSLDFSVALMVPGSFNTSLGVAADRSGCSR